MPSKDEIVQKELEKQLAIIENFIARYLAETGARVQDTTLVEQRKDPLTTLYWCEPKPKIDLSKSEAMSLSQSVVALVERVKEIQEDLLRLLQQLKD